MNPQHVRGAAAAHGGPPATVPFAAGAKLGVAIAALCAAASLAGWTLDVPLLASVIPVWPAVKPVTAGWILVTAAGFALLLSDHRRARAAGLPLLALDAIGVLVSMLWPEARHLPGGAMQGHAGSVILLIIAGIACVAAPRAKRVPAGRVLAAAAAALLCVGLIGNGFSLLLARAPPVDVSLPSLVALLCLSCAVGVVRPDRRPLGQPATRRPGAVITRRLLPAAFLLPVVVGWLAVAGESAGVLDSALGAALQTVLAMLALAALVVWAARRLDFTEAQRDSADLALRESYAELDRRVQERTAALEHANAALHESMEVEQRVRLQAERANRAKDEFLSVVSHELRSPLNALRGWGFLLGSAKSPDADLIGRATQAIQRNVDLQARLIDDMLDASRILSGRLKIERRPVNFVEVVRGALESVRQAAAAKHITVELATGCAALELEGDAARLQQIAMNLLSNAVKFTAEAGHVTASVDTSAGFARLAITDTGSGIEPDILPHIFDRFTQAETPTKRQHGGLGIGLALVQHLAELHGGSVSAASDGVGKGSTFTVCLPLPAQSPPSDRSTTGSGTPIA